MSDQDINYVEQYVGEGKPFTSPDEALPGLAKKAYNADSFIETLKAEKRELESQLTKYQSKEDNLDTIVSLLQAKEEPKLEEPIKEEKEEVNTQPTQPSLDVALAQREFAKMAVDTFGSAVEAGKAIKEYVNNDPGRQTLVNTLMQTDPNALLKIVNKPVEKEPETFNPTAKTALTTGSTPALQTTWAEQQKLMKENPRAYRSPENQRKLQQSVDAAKAAGIDFFKG